MLALVDFALRSVLLDPDQLQIQVVEGEATDLFEVRTSDADRQRLLADDRALMASVQVVVSAAAGRKRAVVDLIEPASSGADAGEE